METLHGERQHDQSDDEQRSELRPQHVEAYTLEKHAADDDENVAQRVDETEPLDNGGMLAMGKIKPEKSIAGKKQKNVAIIACCCVWLTVEMKSPMPSVLSKNSATPTNSNRKLPWNGNIKPEQADRRHKRRVKERRSPRTGRICQG